MTAIVKGDDPVTFSDLESDVGDVVRIADLALHVYGVEYIGHEKISEDGTLLLVLEHLADKAQALRKRYYEAHKAA
jgi:hypothetical protein